MSRVTSNDFEKVTSGYEIWSLEIEILLFHFLQNHERYSDRKNTAVYIIINEVFPIK